MTRKRATVAGVGTQASTPGSPFEALQRATALHSVSDPDDTAVSSVPVPASPAAKRKASGRARTDLATKREKGTT